MLAVHIGVPSHLGMEVGEKIWCTHNGVLINLRKQCSIECCWVGYVDPVLVRILYRYCPLEMVVEVVSDAEFRRTGVRQTHMSLSVFTDWNEDIRRHR